jgi:hypothetical protein
MVTQLLPALFNFPVGGAPRAKEKPDRWNNVFSLSPENVGLWRVHYATTVARCALAATKN